MTGRRRLPLAAFCLLVLIAPLSVRAHGPSGNHEEAAGHDEAAMKAQHERMGRFLSAMQGLSNAIILSDLPSARKGAEKLTAALEGSQKDVPHKNRSKHKEFEGQYTEFRKRVNALQAALQAGDLPKSGAAYGRVLEGCVSCHKMFRD